jgi:ABC-type branched-subunit amino acid transport system ATPase component
LGHACGESRAALNAALERIDGLFPRRRERRRTFASYVFGGEQQMVAIGRALIAQCVLVKFTNVIAAQITAIKASVQVTACFQNT